MRVLSIYPLRHVSPVLVVVYQGTNLAPLSIALCTYLAPLSLVPALRNTTMSCGFERCGLSNTILSNLSISYYNCQKSQYWGDWRVCVITFFWTSSRPPLWHLSVLYHHHQVAHRICNVPVLSLEKGRRRSEAALIYKSPPGSFESAYHHLLFGDLKRAHYLQKLLTYLSPYHQRPAFSTLYPVYRHTGNPATLAFKADHPLEFTHFAIIRRTASHFHGSPHALGSSKGGSLDLW